MTLLLPVCIVLFATLLLQPTESISSRHMVPELHEWPHRPVYLQPCNRTKTLTDGALPLGIPFEVDTPLFQGSILIRFRNAKSDDEKSHNEYFASHQKQLLQTVIQGRFKRPIRFSDVLVGGLFEEPMQLVPPKPLMRFMKALIGSAAPGVIFDLDSDSPKVLGVLAGAARTIRADPQGNEPDMMALEFVENIGEAIGKYFRSPLHRQRHMHQKADQYMFEPDTIYTFHNVDETLDYGAFEVRLPVYGSYKLQQAIGPQPMSLATITNSGETIFNINVWHESIFNDA